jgi:hypothetical protein
MIVFNWRSHGLAVSLGFWLTLAAIHPVQAQRAAHGPPDWPCVQRLIPEIAWGTLWAGPSIDELDRKWWEDEEVGRVVRYATDRKTSQEDAVERVREFVDGLEDDREQRLTLLFSGLFELINRERSRTIEYIRSYSRGQVARLEAIGELVDELEQLRESGSGRAERIARLEYDLHWEQHTFQTRQQSLRALCEQPYLQEEKLSRMVRIIQDGM